MLKIWWWLIMTTLLMGLAGLYEYIEGRYKNANLFFLIFDIGIITALVLPVMWLMV